jgi:regulator of replication initiation timing
MTVNTSAYGELILENSALRAENEALRSLDDVRRLQAENGGLRSSEAWTISTLEEALPGAPRKRYALEWYAREASDSIHALRAENEEFRDLLDAATNRLLAGADALDHARGEILALRAENEVLRTQYGPCCNYGGTI